MNLDLSKFKKIKDEGESAVLQHPDGHQIILAKKGLNPKHQKDLGSLRTHMADGGMAQKDPQTGVPQTQPTIVINNGPQQPQAPQMPMGFTVPQGGGMPVFDVNKFALQSPDAPIEGKMQALNAEQSKMNQAKMAEEASQRKAFEEYQKMQEYNQRAAQMGVPGVQMPAQAPVMPASMAQPAQDMGVAPPMVPQQAPQPQGDPYGTQAYYDAYSGGLREQKAGIQQQAQAESAMGKEQAQLLNQQVQKQEEKLLTYQENYSSLEKERNAFVSDLQNQHIDSNRLLNEMGGGKKVMTAIGLILGGMGGGLMHQENPALKFLQSQIQNDIEAQKANLGKGESLLKANLQQFGNLNQAAQMTQAMMNDVISNQLKEAAAKAADPLAKARALQAAGQLDVNSAGILSQIAMRKTMLSGMQAGKIDPSMTIRMIVPEGEKSQAYKELAEAQQLTKFRDNALAGFDSLDKINTVGNRMTSPVQTPRQVNSIRSVLLSEMSKELAGKFTEFEMENLKSAFPEAGDSKETINLKKAKLNQILGQKMNFPILSSYGIMPQNNSRYESSGEKKIKLGPPVAESNAKKPN